jgi:flotillin
LEAQGIAGEAEARRAQEVAIAEQQALTVQGSKHAEAEQRVKVAQYEAGAVEGENQSKAQIADYEATLDERQAEAARRGEVAMAEARRDVLMAEKQQELARMEKEVIAKEMIERQQVEITAEAEAEKRRRIARGEADAVLAKYTAEAEGVQKVLAGKAEGYQALMRACGERKELAASLLIIEQLPQLVAEQVKAIQNLKIDKITVWDGGGTGPDGEADGSTARFMRSLIGSLPPMHELAQQAGIDLPEVLGKVDDGTVGDATPPAAADAQTP